MKVCETLVKSEFLPKNIDTPQKAAAIALKGNELGIPLMHSFSHIHIIKRTPACSAELQLGLLRRGGVTWEFAENTDETATIIFSRPGFQPYTSSFTMEEASRAGLTSNPTWKQYPKAMLRARAISAGARVIGPDLIGGMSYTPEELGATVNMETGEVIETQAEVVDTKPAQNGQPKQEKQSEFDGIWDFNTKTKQIVMSGNFPDTHEKEKALLAYLLDVMFPADLDEAHKVRAREVMEANLDMIASTLLGKNLDAITARFTELKLHTVGEGATA